MREIKFRGKRDDTNEWHYWEVLMGHKLKYNSVVLETIGQYTGLKDKNGVEVYEGDMVIYDFANGGKDPVVGIVKYKTECASFGVVPLAYMDSIILFADLDLNAPLEVVATSDSKEELGGEDE